DFAPARSGASAPVALGWGPGGPVMRLRGGFWRGLAAAGWLALGAAPAWAAPPDPQARESEARRQLQARDPAAAEVQLRALLAESRDPDTRLRARILLAEALRLQWRTAEAEPEARAAVAEAQGRGDAFAEAWAVGTLGDVLLAMDQAEA